MSGIDWLKPTTYGVQIGNVWVAIDFEARAVSVSKDRRRGSAAHTEDLGNGFLVDRDGDWKVIAVEIIAAGEEDGR